MLCAVVSACRTLGVPNLSGLFYLKHNTIPGLLGTHRQKRFANSTLPHCTSRHALRAIERPAESRDACLT